MRDLVNFIILILIVIFVFFYSTQFDNFINQEKISELKLNEFGDFIGGILNPLLSFFAFCALLYTIHIQRIQINNDKKDRKKQQFESTFFSMLNVHNNLLSELNKKNELNNISNIEKIIHDIKDKLTGKTENKEYIFLPIAKNTLIQNNELCSNYYLVLYQLLKFISTNAPSGIEKNYSNIIRALLSDDVMKVLAINCFYEDKKDTYKSYFDLLEKYSFFEHTSFNPKSSNYKKAKPNLPSSEYYFQKMLDELHSFYILAF